MKRPKGFRYAREEHVSPGHDAGDPDIPVEDQEVEQQDLEFSGGVPFVPPPSQPVLDLSDRFHHRFARDDSEATRDDGEATLAETGRITPEQVGDPDEHETQEIAVARSKRAARPWQKPQVSAEDAEYRAAKKALKQAERQRKRRERKERQRFTQQQRAARTRVLIVLGAVSLLLLSVAIGVFTPLMSVQQIDVQGTQRVPVAQVTDALAGLEGRPLALVADDEVHHNLQAITLLESFAVEKIPPSTLRIVVTERQPVVAVPHGDSLLLVDPVGVRVDEVARDARPAGIPVIEGAGDDYTADEFVAIATALRSMPAAAKERIAEVRADTPQQILMTLEDGLPVMWGDATQNSRKAVVLESMLQALSDVALKSVDVSSPEAPVYVPVS